MEAITSSHFFRALQFGNQYIYQAMPRMLSLWLDFGAKVCEYEKGKYSHYSQVVVGIHNLFNFLPIVKLQLDE